MGLVLLALGLLCGRPAQAQSGYPGGGYPGGGYPGGGYPGGYPGSGGGWVPSDHSGTPLPNNGYGYDPNTGGANLLPSGKQPKMSNTYPIPDDAEPWWFAAFAPNKYTQYNPYTSFIGLSLHNDAGNTTVNKYGQLLPFYDPVDFNWDRSDATPLPPDLLGSVHADNSDTLKAYFVWTGDPAKVPDHADFLLHTHVKADAFISYGNGGATSGMSATAMATLEADTVTADAGTAGSGSPAPHDKSVLVWATPNGNLITLSRSASVSTDTSNGLHYATWVPGDHDFYYSGSGNGYTSASVNASVSAEANTDNREVTISSDIDPSSYKGAVDAQHTRGQWPHVPSADGSMQVDAGVVPNTGILGGGGYHADVTYTANTVNFHNATDPIGNYRWSHPGGSAGENQTPADKSITVHYNFGSSASATPLGVSNTTTVTVPDDDGTTGDASYTVQWHYPYENWVKNGSNYELTPLKYTSDGAPVAANGTYHITIPADTTDFSIPLKILGGAGTVGAAVFAPYVDPVLLFFMISVGYTAGLATPPDGNDFPCLGNASQLSKDVGIQEQINQTGTSGAYMPTTPRMPGKLADDIKRSGDYNGYVSGSHGPPGLVFSVTVYQHKWHQDYIGDSYDGHGYAGQAPGYANWTGGYEYVYSWGFGQTSS